MIDSPAKNTMMSGAPKEKAPDDLVGVGVGKGFPPKNDYHFSGQGIWHNLTVAATTIQEAERIWLEVRKLIKLIP